MGSNTKTKQKNEAMRRVFIILAMASLLALVVMVVPLSVATDCKESCTYSEITTSSSYTTTEHIAGTHYCMVWKVTKIHKHPCYKCQSWHSCKTNKKCEADGDIHERPAGHDSETSHKEPIGMSRWDGDNHGMNDQGADNHGAGKLSQSKQSEDKQGKDKQGKDKQDRGKQDRDKQGKDKQTQSNLDKDKKGKGIQDMMKHSQPKNDGGKKK